MWEEPAPTHLQRHKRLYELLPNRKARRLAACKFYKTSHHEKELECFVTKRGILLLGEEEGCAREKSHETQLRKAIANRDADTFSQVLFEIMTDEESRKTCKLVAKCILRQWEEGVAAFLDVVTRVARVRSVDPEIDFVLKYLYRVCDKAIARIDKAPLSAAKGLVELVFRASIWQERSCWVHKTRNQSVHNLGRSIECARIRLALVLSLLESDFGDAGRRTVLAVEAVESIEAIEEGEPVSIVKLTLCECGTDEKKKHGISKLIRFTPERLLLPHELHNISQELGDLSCDVYESIDFNLTLLECDCIARAYTVVSNMEEGAPHGLAVAVLGVVADHNAIDCLCS